MPTRDSAPNGAPCWVDLMTSDTERSRAFYCDLFGWTAEPPAEEFGGYINFQKDGVRVAGCMAQQPGQEMPDVWTVYLTSGDAAKTVEAATANGGQVIVPAMPVGDLGMMAVVSDVGGAVVGVWQPGAHQGFGLVTESGAPSWFEVSTRDYAATVDFYRNVFGWTTTAVSDTEEFRYTTMTQDEEWYAGIFDGTNALPEGMPAHWAVYFGVDDADAALKQIVDLGGSVITPAEDTPYGRLATAADPTGAVFKLVAPNDAMPAR